MTVLDEEDLYRRLEAEVELLFAAESSGHDKYHLIRVRKLALLIQACEGGDRLVIGVAAFLHDIHRGLQRQEGRYCTPEESLPFVSQILDKFQDQISAQQREQILHCIRYHEEYSFNAAGKTARDLATQIVQDADNLDAIGAIGIARTFMYSGSKGIPMYLPEVPLVGREDYREETDDPSDIHHFYSKMLRLRETMNTIAAKTIAIGRHAFIEEFLRQFFAEWKQDA